MDKIIKKIAGEVIGKLEKEYTLKDYIAKSTAEKKQLVLQSFLEELVGVIDYGFGQLNYDKTLSALKQDFNFEKIEMPLEYGFSIMYCDSKKLLCRVEDNLHEAEITCASPYLDTTKTYRNYGEFMQSMTNGELSAMFSMDAKGEIDKNQLPLLSTSEETEDSQVSFETYYHLSEEEADRYNATGVLRGVSIFDAVKMEDRYNEEMKARAEHRETLLNQRIAMLPASFKSYICMAEPKEKNLK